MLKYTFSLPKVFLKHLTVLKQFCPIQDLLTRAYD